MTDNNINEIDIKNAYYFLNHENETEIRAIGVNGIKEIKQFFIHNADEFLDVCKNLNGKFNLYVGINERKPKGGEKKDVLSVKTIIIDIDPIRPKNTPATNEEIKYAENTCNEIIQHLIKYEIKNVLKVFSGNGYQIWIPIDKIDITDENRDDIEKRIQKFQRIIIDSFNDDYVKIDQIGDLPRIIRIPGTLNVKGSETENRKHRIAKIITEIEVTEERKFNLEANNIIKGYDIETEKTMPVFQEETSDDEYVQNVFANDQELYKIYMGHVDWKQKYKSRSEAEFAVILKFIEYGISKEKIFNLMKLCGLGKWQETTDKYKEHTYEKAIQTELRSREWGFKIVSFSVYPGTPPYYEIVVKGKKIKLSSEDILNQNKFRQKYFETFNVLLVRLKEEHWTNIVNNWTMNKIDIKNDMEETLSEDQEAIECITNYINKAQLTDNINMIDRQGVVYYNEKSNTITVLSGTIRKILTNSGIKIPLRKLSYIMIDFVVSGTKPVRIGKRLERCWIFNSKKFDIDEKDITSFKEDVY